MTLQDRIKATEAKTIKKTETKSITVYAASYMSGLCRLLDNTDAMTDYLEYERVIINNDSPYWKQVNAQCKRREVKIEELH